MNGRLLSTVLVLGLVGCAGAGSSVTAPAAPAAAPVTTNDASVVSTIVVPAASAAQTARRADYISASSLGLKVTVTDIPPAGKSASFAPIASSFALTAGVNLIVIPTPASASGHTEDVTYVTYNAAPTAGAIPASAKALGWALSTGLVIAPGQNTNNVALAGVVDGFGLLAASGAFGMMSSSPPTLAGSRTTGMLGAAVTGAPAFSDAGGNSIEGAGGSTWPIVGAVPATVTSAATGVPVSIVETAGTCGAIGAGPHLMLSYNGGAPALTAALSNATDTVAGVYDGNGGAGWSAIVSVKGQSQTLAYTFASLAVTSTSADFSCASQTLSFSQLNESALFTIAETTAAKPYTLTVPATTNCTQSIVVYQGNSVLPAAQIPYGTATSLGANTTFTIQLIPSPPAPNSCTVQLQDAGGVSTYVTAVLPSSTYKIIVP